VLGHAFESAAIITDHTPAPRPRDKETRVDHRKARHRAPCGYDSAVDHVRSTGSGAF
jgi:hypothetical protein